MAGFTVPRGALIGGENDAYAAKIAADRSYPNAGETAEEVRNDSLRACNARTLERLNDLHVNTMQLVDVIAQLGGDNGPGNIISTGRGALDKEPPEPSAPVFQARRIEQRVEQQIDMQRNLINKLRSLIG